MADQKTLYSWASGFDSEDHMNRFLITAGAFLSFLLIFVVIIFGVLRLNVKTTNVEVSIGGEKKVRVRSRSWPLNGTASQSS